MSQNYKKGEVIFVDLGEPGKSVKGHEQGNKRPCVVVKSFPTLELCIVLPCTSKKPKFSFYTNVAIPKGSGGLKTDSIVLCHQIRTISYDRIINTIGHLSNIDIAKIDAVMLDTLDL